MPKIQDENRFYEEEPARLREAIGEEEVRRLFSYPECELEHDYYGFLWEYAYLQGLPKDMTIIDVGCYQAFQSKYYEDHAKYIGVDIDVPCEWRLKQNNAEHYLQSGQEFIEETLPRLIKEGLDLENTFIICSAVPDFELQKMIAATFPYYAVTYPSKEPLYQYPKGFSGREAKPKSKQELEL